MVMGSRMVVDNPKIAMDGIGSDAGPRNHSEANIAVPANVRSPETDE